MNIICLVLGKHNLTTSLKCLKHVNRSLLPNKFIIRNFKNMSQKISQNKTYIAVNIPENANNATRRTFWSHFKRDASTKTKKEVKTDVPEAPRLNKADLARLFSLAKPEKWRLIGILFFIWKTSIIVQF